MTHPSTLNVTFDVMADSIYRYWSNSNGSNRLTNTFTCTVSLTLDWISFCSNINLRYIPDTSNAIVVIANGPLGQLKLT